MMPQPSPNGTSPQGGGPPTANPAVMPNAMMGVPPPMPTPQGGPNVPPGTPRQGAQEGEPDELLRSLGLISPRGG